MASARARRGIERLAEYHVWRNMKRRCTDCKHPQWKDYGGRGIAVCDRWLRSFQDFLSDVGRRPSADLTLDRIDNDGNYEPGNCRWATWSQQAANRRPSLGQTRVTRTRYANVYRRRDCNRWRVIIAREGHKFSRGQFRTALEAALARDDAVRSLGMPMPLNFPERFK